MTAKGRIGTPSVFGYRSKSNCASDFELSFSNLDMWVCFLSFDAFSFITPSDAESGAPPSCLKRMPQLYSTALAHPAGPPPSKMHSSA